MEKNLARKCDKCGEVSVVFMKQHYLGIHFVEKCKCCTKLCSDPFEINWTQYSTRSKNK